MSDKSEGKKIKETFNHPSVAAMIEMYQSRVNLLLEENTKKDKIIKAMYSCLKYYETHRADTRRRLDEIVECYPEVKNIVKE